MEHQEAAGAAAVPQGYKHTGQNCVCFFAGWFCLSVIMSTGSISVWMCV